MDNDRLKIESILGGEASAHPLRASRDGHEFEGIMPAPTFTEVLVKRNGTVTDTVAEMKKVIKSYAWQTAKLAPLLKGKDLYDTCRKIWEHLFLHIKYKEDTEGKEELRLSTLSWNLRTIRGIDCDDFTIFAGSILYNLKIPFYIRIARYAGKDYFQHVYAVIPFQGRRYITIDAVLDEYDSEKTTVETKDFLVMNTSNLNGIDISVLGGVDDDTLNEISGILSGEDFREVAELEGLGNVASRDQELRAIKNHLLRTRRIIAERPHLIKEVEHPQSFLGMVDYALKYWDTDKRDEALDALSGQEDRLNELEGMQGYDEAHEDVELFYGIAGLGASDVLGKVKKQRKFFDKVKQAAKKAGQGIKKIAKGLIRFNPLTVSIRAAVLLALKINLLKVSSKLKWGYLTEAEAREKKFNMDEWRKVKSQLAKAENMFVKILQGKAENFKRAILKGRAGKLSGTGSELGFVVAAATAASATAAVPFITKILNLLKKINYKKLLETVSSLIKKKAAAEESDAPTADGESALPEGGETSEGEESEDNAESGEKKEEGSGETVEGGENAGDSVKAGEGKGNAPADPVENEEGTEEPANKNTRSLTTTPPTPPAPTDDPGIFAKAMEWASANKPIVITGVALVLGGLLYIAFKPKHELAGVRGKGKKKKGKAKTNPPRTIKAAQHPVKKIKL